MGNSSGPCEPDRSFELDRTGLGDSHAQSVMLFEVTRARNRANVSFGSISLSPMIKNLRPVTFLPLPLSFSFSHRYDITILPFHWERCSTFSWKELRDCWKYMLLWTIYFVSSIQSFTYTVCRTNPGNLRFLQVTIRILSLWFRLCLVLIFYMHYTLSCTC